MPMVPMGEILPGTILGMFFTTLNIVDLAMCLSGTEVALTYYRAWPLPIIGSIKSAMVVLVPFLLIDACQKVYAFLKKQSLQSEIGLLNALVAFSLFYVIIAVVEPSEKAAQAPMTLKGKAKAQAEDALVVDLLEGVYYMLAVNLALLVLPILSLGVAKPKAA